LSAFCQEQGGRPGPGADWRGAARGEGGGRVDGRPSAAGTRRLHGAGAVGAAGWHFRDQPLSEDPNMKGLWQSV